MFSQPFHCKSGIDRTGAIWGPPGLTCARLVGASRFNTNKIYPYIDTFTGTGMAPTQTNVVPKGVSKRMRTQLKVGRWGGNELGAHAGERSRREVLRAGPASAALTPPLVEYLQTFHTIPELARAPSRAILYVPMLFSFKLLSFYVFSTR